MWRDDELARQLCTQYANYVNVPLAQFSYAMLVFLSHSEDTRSSIALQDQQQVARNCALRLELVREYKELCIAQKQERPRKPLDIFKFNCAKRTKRNKLSPPQEHGVDPREKEINARYTAKTRTLRFEEAPNQPASSRPHARKRVRKDDEGPSKKQKKLENASSQNVRHTQGGRRVEQKTGEQHALVNLKRSKHVVVRMRQAGVIPKSFKNKITNLTAVINLTTQMTQSCIIALVNHCHKTHISLEPLIKGTGRGAHNFYESLLLYFFKLSRGYNTAKVGFSFGSPERTLFELAKEIFNTFDISRVRRLWDSDNRISFDIDHEKLFDNAATQLDVQMGRLVMGRISQLEKDILHATRENDQVQQINKLKIAQLEEKLAGVADFERFLRLCELAPDHLKPTLEPLSKPTHSFVHIHEKTLFFSLAARWDRETGREIAKNQRTFTIKSTTFRVKDIDEHRGRFLNALFNFAPSDSNVWRTKSGKRMTRFVFAGTVSDGNDRKYLLIENSGVSETTPVLGDFIQTNGHDYMIPFYKRGTKPRPMGKDQVRESSGHKVLPIKEIEKALENKREFDQNKGMHKVRLNQFISNFKKCTEKGDCDCIKCAPPYYVGIDVGERYAVGITAFHRPSRQIKTLAIKMNALARPREAFQKLLERKKGENQQVYALEREMARVKPNQKTLAPLHNPIMEHDIFSHEEMVCAY